MEFLPREILSLQKLRIISVRKQNITISIPILIYTTPKLGNNLLPTDLKLSISSLFGQSDKENLPFIVEACPKVDECRLLLTELCIGLHRCDFPVLILLQIHQSLCQVLDLDCKKVHVGDHKFRIIGYELPLSMNICWQIAKKIKHFKNS